MGSAVSSRRLKRLSAAVSAVAVAIVLAACGGDDEPTTTAAAGGASEGGSAKGMTIGLIPSTLQSELLQGYVGYMEKACEPIDCTVDVRDPAGDPSKMAQAMQALIAKKVDAIALMAVPAGPIQQQLPEAKAAGIPVVALAFAGDEESMAQFDFTVADDTPGLAKVLADWIVENRPDIPVVGARVSADSTGDSFTMGAQAALKEQGVEFKDLKDNDLADIVNSMVKNTTTQLQQNPGPLTLVHHADFAPTVLQPVLDRQGRDDVLIATQYLTPASAKLMSDGGNYALASTNAFVHVFEFYDRLLRWKAGGEELDRSNVVENDETVVITKDNLPESGEPFPFAPALEEQAAEWREKYDLD